MAYRRNTRSRTTGTARWMDLRYPGTCKVCATPLPAGARAFYDPVARTTTCASLDCAKADGLTKSEWHGSPISGRWVDVLNDHRIGAGAPVQPMVNGRPIEWHPTRRGVFRYIESSDGRWFARTRYGVRGGYEHTGIRCEDAPCCGCC